MRSARRWQVRWTVVTTIPDIRTPLRTLRPPTMPEKEDVKRPLMRKGRKLVNREMTKRT